MRTGRKQIQGYSRKAPVNSGKKPPARTLPQKCPYCGGKMLIAYPEHDKVTAGEKSDSSERQINPVMVCDNDDCTCYLNLRINWDGKLFPVGIPADEGLRILRTESHHYLEYFQKATGMDMGAAYHTISDIMGLPVSMCHISMLNEVQCRRLTAELLKYIIRMGRLNPEKLKKTGQLIPFHSSRGYTSSSMEAQNIVKEVNEIATGTGKNSTL